MAQQDSRGGEEAAVSGVGRPDGRPRDEIRGDAAERHGRSIRVPLSAPLDLAESLEPFRRSGDDLLDRWDGTRLLRVAAVAGRWIAVRAEPIGDRDDPALEVTLEEVTLEEPTAASSAADPTAPPAAVDPTLVDRVAQAVRVWFVVAPPAF